MPSPPAPSYRILSRDGKPQRANRPTTSKLKIGGCRFTQRLRDRPLANEKVEQTAPKPFSEQRLRLRRKRHEPAIGQEHTADPAPGCSFRAQSA